MGDSDSEIIISYDALFELVRREKNREELQRLSASFYGDVMLFLREKTDRLDSEKNKQDLFSADSRFKDRKEIENIKKLLRELYERRERKIISMAVNKARTGSELIDTTSLLDEEKQLFSSLVLVLGSSKDRIFSKMFVGKAIEVNDSQIFSTPQIKPKPMDNESDTKMVIFSHEVPRFLGENLEVYGPFNKEDIATLPRAIADVLIGNKRAEELKED